LLIDIHVHSEHTPDGPPLSDLVDAVKDKGLDGFCLTDVHTVAGGPEAKRLASEAGLTALVGFEALTDRGHFLVFVAEPDSLPAIDKWLRFDADGRIPFASLAEAVEARDGVIVAAHPYDRDTDRAPGDSVVQLDAVGAIEVHNARRAQLVNELAEEVAAGTGLPGVAGSDARHGLGDIGRVASLVEGQLDGEIDLIDRIRSFQIWPVTIGGKPGGAQPNKRRPTKGRGRPRRSAGGEGRERSGANKGADRKRRTGRDGKSRRRGGRRQEPAGPRGATKTAAGDEKPPSGEKKS